LNLNTYLRTKRNARKIFGRRELEIISRQLEGLPLTQSERNRLSRDIKPKFELIRELAAYSDEFGMEKNQDNKRMIEKAVGIMLEDALADRIQAILLFGSFADNSFTKSSDIDICAVFKQISLREATEFRIRISGQLPEKIDVQVFNTLPPKLRREIAKNHKVLYKSEAYDNVNLSVG